jgi:peptidoglycan/LPS O-acetylase OafA/YrhL
MQLCGAILLVYTVSKSPALQSLFTNSIARHLGKISYGLYLTHGPICHMVGFVLIPTLWKWTNGPVQSDWDLKSDQAPDPGRSYGGGTAFGYNLGFFLGAAIVVPLTLWVAGLFTRYIDEPSVRFAKRIENRFSSED